MTLTIGILLWLIGFFWGREIFHRYHWHPHAMLASALRGAASLFILAGIVMAFLDALK